MILEMLVLAYGYLLVALGPIVAFAFAGDVRWSGLGLFLSVLGGWYLHRRDPPGKVSLPRNSGLAAARGGAIGGRIGGPGPLLALLLAAFALTACPKPTPGPGGPTPVKGVIECAVDAVQSCAPSALPAVNSCLAGHGDVTSCLLGLIQPVGCVTYEVVACLVNHEGAAASTAARANPDNTRDARVAQRAREFLDGQGIRFAE